MLATLLGVALALAPPPEPAPPASLPIPPSAEEVFALPPELRTALHEQVRSRGGNSGQQRMNRLVQFLFTPEGLGISYRHDADHTVAEAWATREANCLSFTLLTIALARELGIEAYGQEVTRTLTWYSEGDTLYFSNHVNAGVLTDGHRFSIDVASDSVMLGELPRRIDDRRLLATLYTNRAASLLARARFDHAQAYMDAALQADPGYPAAWNNAGVLALRQGRTEDAERNFLHTLSLSREHEGALMNLASLYAHRGDKRREQDIRKRIARAQQRNPFHYFMLAVDDEKRGDYPRAVQRYRAAIRLHQAEHRFHSGLARAYLHLGEYRKASEALRQAQRYATRSTAEAYQAKLDQLSRKGH